MKSNGLWTFVTALTVALVISSTTVFISFQYNQTQKDIANTQAKMEARKQCANNIPDEEYAIKGTNTSGLASYTNYPSFDRCMANKGF